MTNYEKIISMSIEELADFLESIDCVNLQPWHFYYYDHYCKGCGYAYETDKGRCEDIEFDSRHGCSGIRKEIDSIIGEWLKAEAEVKKEK